MIRILSMSTDAAIAAVILVPLFLYLNRRYIHNNVRTVGYILLTVYLSGMFAVVGLPDILYFRFDPRFNFIPFRYLFSDAVNSLLNVLLFIPMGMMLPLLWQVFRKVHCTVLWGFLISLSIELQQIFTYRATDVNDLITNTLGTFIGWCMAGMVIRLFSLQPDSNSRTAVFWVFGAAYLVMFFLHPLLSLLIRI